MPTAMSRRAEEILGRAEGLRAALVEARLEATRAARSLLLAPTYEAHGAFLARDAVPDLERELSEATDENEDRCRRLLARVAEERVRATVAPLDDERSVWERAVSVRSARGEIAVREAPDAIGEEEDREGRRRLEEEWLRRLEEVAPLELDRLNRWRDGVESLGYGGAVEARERLAGVRLDPLLAEAHRILRETETVHADALADAVERRLGVPVRRAETHDLRRIERLPWLDPWLADAPLLDPLREDLKALGLPLEAGGRLELLVPRRGHAGERSACFPIDVPGRIVLLVVRGPGHSHRSATLAAVGRALHAAFTEPGLPPEHRVLGDPSVAEAHAATFERLLLAPSWLRRAAALDPAAARECARGAALVALVELRRTAALLARDVELWRSEAPVETAEAWTESMSATLGCRHDPRAHLEGHQPWLETAFRLRGLLAGAACGRRLRDRFDEDWFRNPRAGPELRGWLAEGTRRDAGGLSDRAGAPRLGADDLLALTLEALD